MPRIFSKCRSQKSKFALLCVLIAAVSCLISIGFSAEAAGSRNLTATKTGTTWVSNTGYRPYIEWNNASTAGIVRHQIIKVYAYAGEKLYFGSSVSAGVNGDIVVRKPDGTAMAGSPFDVNAATGAGYINTRAKELAGPICPGGDTTGTGYTPLSLTVDQTGIWEFEFHSVDPTNSNDNPTPALNTQTTLSAGGVGVAAWDVTVVKNSQIVTGRVFTNFLSLNMGWNSDGTDVLNATVYVLTKDGYVYQTNFNGMDPYGFVFFANNRGLVRADTNTSLYQSGASPSSG